jgi:hypothetical protein
MAHAGEQRRQRRLKASLGAHLSDLFELAWSQKQQQHWKQQEQSAEQRRLGGAGTGTLLNNDRPISVVPYMAELADAGYKLLVYNGDRDLSCNVQGTEVLLDSMEWNGADAWADSTQSRRSLWLVDGAVAGYTKAHAGLEFVVVYNSGHLVPLNQPKHALDLVTRFVMGQSFADAPLPVYTGGAGGADGKDGASEAGE